MIGPMTGPTDPDPKQRGFFREFFSDYHWHDWLEFAIYCALAIGALGAGVSWLLGRF